MNNRGVLSAVYLLTILILGSNGSYYAGNETDDIKPLLPPNESLDQPIIEVVNSEKIENAQGDLPTSNKDTKKFVPNRDAKELIVRTPIQDINKLKEVIRDASKIEATDERIAFISSWFIGVKYKAGTLIGSATTKEKLVVDLKDVDCFTFLDYVESIRLSRDFNEFKIKLAEVRYKEGLVSFVSRNHFFSDWAATRPSVTNITGSIGKKRAITVVKYLNLDKIYVNGIPPRVKAITFIPSKFIDAEIVSQLNTGDYIGLYVAKNGLDVSHVGIFIRDKSGHIYLRNASSKRGKVIDQDFLSATRKKAGIIIYRPKPNEPEPNVAGTEMRQLSEISMLIAAK